MGACFSKYAGDDPRFVGLSFTEEAHRRARAYIERMDALAPLYFTHLGLLRGMQKRGNWDIYLQVSDWDRPITHAIVATLVAAFRRACRAWLADLRFNVRVRVFGFVFRKGVVLDPSFLQGPYGKHPRVTERPHDTEASPWRVRRGPGDDWNQSNYYDPGLDLYALKVVGNRTVKGAVFHPPLWEDYEHPEGCRGYQTKFWLGAAVYRAFAQRHYLRVSRVADPATGAFDAQGTTIFLHEMGHCLFLDDMYDASKYPRPLASCGCSLKPEDTIMYSASKITNVDRAMLRHVWQIQKKM